MEEIKSVTEIEKEKIALVEISPYQVKLSLAWYAQDSFEVFDEYCEKLMLHEDIERDGFIKPTQVAHCREVIKMYRKLCDSFGITKSIAYATNEIRSAKNHYGFLDEMELSSGFKFKLLSQEDETVAIHTATVNSLDITKGLILFVEEEQTRVIGYIRRAVVGSQVIPFGYENLCKLFMEEGKFGDQAKVIKDFMQKQFQKIDWFGDIDLSEIQVIGMGEIFDIVGKVSRKGKKYSLDMPHNYKMSQADFKNVYDAITSLSLDKKAKLKGISKKSVGSIVSGVAIISALASKYNIQEFTVSTSTISTGMLFSHCVPITQEKPLQDLLGYSLGANQRFYQEHQKNGAHIFELSMLLFKQLRVMHRLSRLYIKPLKIASYMYNAGARVRHTQTKKDSLGVILHSQIYGASHRDLILGAFIAGTQFSEEFSLSEWVKYKDLVTDEDLQAVKFLAVLVRLASCFDVAGKGYVKDIVCDVLGDSVIMKTIREEDISFELKLANEVGNEFKHIFGKSLELL
ncbi:MAG: hypothetical protein IJ837_00835 [Clostridia bacterium]|nr:hypothetical protein [Clostridia bacterium]